MSKVLMGPDGRAIGWYIDRVPGREYILHRPLDCRCDDCARRAPVRAERLRRLLASVMQDEE